MSVHLPRRSDYDVIIVGGGPAGLSAALVLGRCRRRVLLFDAGTPRNYASHALHGFLTRDGLPPQELRRIGRQQLQQYDSVELLDIRVEDTVPVQGGFDVSVEDGERFRSRKLVLATGVEDETPPVKGFERLYGAGVFHCPYCDGWEVRDQPLGVLASGEQGVGLAEEITIWSRDVTLLSNAGHLPEGAHARLERTGIKLDEREVAAFEGDQQLEAIRFSDGDRLRLHAVFFGGEQRQQSHLPEKLGCDVTDEGVVACGEAGETSVAGLFIVGDASRRLPVHFAIAAAAEGAETASKINTQLLAEDLSSAWTLPGTPGSNR